MTTTLFGIDTRVLFTALVALVVLQRLGELVAARLNRSHALARGGVETGADHYPVMVAVHTAFLVSCLVEVWGGGVWWSGRPFLPWLGWSALAVLVAAQMLRGWVLATLGRRWTTRVIVVPGDGPVTGGPYRFLRHPNYLAVVLEIAALPLVHTAWVTALLFSLANGLVLRTRIRIEEAALEDGLTGDGGWRAHFGGRGRLLPGGTREGDR